ncbi:MAG: hypothetical protein NWF00_11325 [Candidatus Bathyarchaeota archaeon]|nr:hypothetical protein [Candidatus Bathyarchaeota archaeon]
MSRIMRAMPIWLGAVYSNKAFLLHRLEVIIKAFFGQLLQKSCDKLKYVQRNFRRYKRVKTEIGKSGKFVQETLFRGGTI